MSTLLKAVERVFSPKEPVSFKEFCESKEFFDEDPIYDFWKENGDALPTNCSELLLDGSLGGGKSFFASKYICYRVYRLFLNGDPRPSFGMAPHTPLFVFYFSTSITQAKRSGFNYLKSVFKECKWFQNNMPVDDSIESIIRFKDADFEIVYASSENHQTGINVWGFILDEANFRNGVGNGVSEQYDEVTFLYEQLIDRLYSRFATPTGVNALAVLVSSASYQSSFSEKRKTAIEESGKGNIITSVSYLVKPWQHSDETFTVFIGAGAVEPCIVESEEHKQSLIKLVGYEGLDVETKLFRDVPVNLKPIFETNIATALQNHCGVPTHIKGRLISNLGILYKSYVNDILPIFVSNELECSTADNTALIEYLIPENIRYAESPHCLHIDLSVQGDTGGITCTRFDGTKDGLNYHTRVFTLGIIPPTYPAMTRITKIREFVRDLSQFLNIVAVSTDNFQSVGLRQDITADLNLEDIRLSIDSTDQYHLHWLRALVDGRYRQVKDARIEKEVKDSEHDLKKHRVLKRKGSTDDIFQSVVGSFWLSDTIGCYGGDITELYQDRRINIVGTRSAQDMLKKLGRAPKITLKTKANTKSDNWF